MNAKRAVPIIVTALVVTAIVSWFFMRDANPTKALAASGTVEATDADLGFQAGGRIAAIDAVEGTRVTAGTELARLDVAELDARRAGAMAQVAVARAQLAELERGARPEELAQARAAMDAARERLADAERQRDRLRVLHDGGAISRQALDQANTAYEVARAQHAQARDQVEMVQQGPRSERIAAQRAAVQQSEAMLAQADAALAHAVIRAPFDGVITIRHREAGEAVSAGAPVVTMMNPADRWVRIYVREDAIGQVHLGQRAEITTDSDPGTRHIGQVTFIASNAEFTPRNVQTAEERVKLVYAVKVRIDGDEAMILKPGIPADVRLLTQP